MSDDENLIALYPEYDPDPDVVFPYTPGLDNSSVRCICNIPFDDGATIQCDGCWVWQHMVCMEIDRSCIPKVYYCEECRERPVNVQKAILNQEKMQKQRKFERISVIKEILIKKGIIDKPSPRKKKESRGRKVLQSPKRTVKPAKKVVDQQSPLANVPPTAVNSRIIVPEFPFRDILCLDDWTDGFLGRGPEKIKKVIKIVNLKSGVENPFDAEYSDWAVNCAKVEANHFIGLDNAVKDFIKNMEKIAQEWDGGALKREHQLKSLGGKEDSATLPIIENSENMDVKEMAPKQEDVTDTENEEVIINFKDEGNLEIPETHKSVEPQSVEVGDDAKSMDLDESGELLVNDDVEECSGEVLSKEEENGDNLVKTEQDLAKELKSDDAPKIDAGNNEDSTTHLSKDFSEELNGSTIVEENQIEWVNFASHVLVTTKKVLKTAPVRYSVDLVPIKGENQIPYYGLFSTCFIPQNSFICTTFGTLSKISDLSPSLLPCKVVNDIYTIPPFTLKVLQNENWILDSRTRGDLSGRYMRRSCSAAPANATLYCMIVKDEPMLSEKLVFGIFSTKEIPAGDEIILSTPGCHSFPCACEIASKCTVREHLSNISQEYGTSEISNSADKKEVKVQKKTHKTVVIKKRLPMFLRVLVLSHQKKIKSLKAEKILEPPVPVSSLQIPKDPALSHSRTPSGSVLRRKPPPSPAVESPKALSREERKLKEQLALFEKMEQQDKKKRKRRTPADPSMETISPASKKEYEESEEDNYTGSSSKFDNETSESIGRDSPASITDVTEKHEDQLDSKRKLETLSESDALVFKKPKFEKLEKSEENVQNTPAPLVRKLSLKDFLQKRNQNKTPSPSSSNQFFAAENPAT